MRAGDIVPGEMMCMFICRIGMVLVVAKDKVGAAVQMLGQDSGGSERTLHNWGGRWIIRG